MNSRKIGDKQAGICCMGTTVPQHRLSLPPPSPSRQTDRQTIYFPPTRALQMYAFLHPIPHKPPAYPNACNAHQHGFSHPPLMAYFCALIPPLDFIIDGRYENPQYSVLHFWRYAEVFNHTNSIRRKEPLLLSSLKE